MTATTVLDTVTRALRSMGVVRRGGVPKAADQADAVQRLQGLILALPGLLQNSVWTEVAVDDDYEAEEGDRCTVTSPGAVTLPTTITDCRTNDARPPMDLAKVQILGADAENAGLWLYSASNGEWRQADALTISDDLPFGPEDEEGIAAQLAVNMVDEYGAEVSARTVALAQMSARSLRARLKKAEPANPTRPGGSLYLDLDYI